jgi:hypothetical protein
LRCLKSTAIDRKEQPELLSASRIRGHGPRSARSLEQVGLAAECLTGPTSMRSRNRRRTTHP